MAIHGLNTFPLLNGRNMRNYLNKFSTVESTDKVESSVFKNKAKTFLIGMDDGTVTASGLMDESEDEDEETVNDLFKSIIDKNGLNNLVWYPQGNAFGVIGFGMSLIDTVYAVDTAKDQSVNINFAGQSNEGIDNIICIHELKSEAASGEGTVYDRLAGSTKGGVAYLHVSSVTGTIHVIIEHSINNADWTTLAQFNILNGVGSDRVEFTGAVNRYIRASYTIVTGPAIFNVSIGTK